MVVPYLTDLTTDEQKARWLPKFMSGECIGSIAMSEPAAGSDLAGIKTTARRRRRSLRSQRPEDLHQQRHARQAGLTAVKTDPWGAAQGHQPARGRGGMDGFTRGRKLDKIGRPRPGHRRTVLRDVGCRRRTCSASQPRLLPPDAQSAQPSGSASPCTRSPTPTARSTVTKRIRADRHAFGQPIGRFQVNRFALAEMKTKLDVAHAYLDRCVQAA